MYVNFCLHILTKSPAIPQQLYKPASRSFSAIAELLVFLLSCLTMMHKYCFSCWWWGTYFFGVTMPPKIFMGDVCWLAMPPNECARALYRRFRPLLLSCLLAQCDSSRLRRVRLAVRSHCRVLIFLQFCSVSVGFLYNFLIVRSNSVIINVEYYTCK